MQTINIMPCGFDAFGTVVQRRMYHTDVTKAFVSVYEYRNIWWYVIDVPDLVDLRSICYVSKANLLAALTAELNALGFVSNDKWRVFRNV